MPLESPTARDGDAGFIGFASRMNPVALPAGMLQLSENMRLNRGTANVASAVNYLQVTNRATGSGPLVSAVGSDTDIDLPLSPKGTGVLRVGTHAAVTTETVTGFITIKDAGGNTRKLAVVS